MADARQIIKQLFAASNLPVSADRAALFDAFLNNPSNAEALSVIIDKQQQLMEKWKLQTRVADIIKQPVRILNGTVGKAYETRLDFNRLQWQDLSGIELAGLEELGLRYDANTNQVTGVPLKSGDFQVLLKFRVTGEDTDAPPHEKPITLIINPDPKSLWKNLPADKNDPYWKEDDVTFFEPIGDRYILASSKRGRAHANVGSFREDHVAFSILAQGWNLVVVSDGAGSAKISRKGSALACEEIVNYFSDPSITDRLTGLEPLLQQQEGDADATRQKTLNREMYDLLGKGVFQVHKKLAEFATGIGVPLKDLHATLIFSLFKKLETGYAFLSFGVGDCPIAVIHKDFTEVTMMNWLDVGEFGGGTRFITMKEIFQADTFASRFNAKVFPDFSYLVMMSDGIYDPKFVVEANLPQINKWKAFFDDLAGKNEDRIAVELDPSNPDITRQFSAWMDFWSQGNHDDRTLAIVF